MKARNKNWQYEKYSKDGFEVLAFPCNQFGSQEKGSEQDIKEFCTKNYAVTFPIFSKVEINGNKAEPLFKFLKPFRSFFFNFLKLFKTL